MSFNQPTDDLSYKYFPGSFRKSTLDFQIGEESIEFWDTKSVTNHCAKNLEWMIKYDDYTHKLVVLKKFLILFECNYRFEFEEIVLEPILGKLCNRYGQNLEYVKKKISKNECISIEENFN